MEYIEKQSVCSTCTLVFSSAALQQSFLSPRPTFSEILLRFGWVTLSARWDVSSFYF